MALSTGNAHTLTSYSAQEERSIRPAPADPLQSIVTGYHLTEVQRHALYALSAALISIKPNRRTNQEQVAIIEKNLLMIADDIAKAETGLIRTLAEKIALAMLNPRVTDTLKKQITKDLWLVLNMADVGSGSLSATASICNGLQERGADPSLVLKIRDTINAIITRHYKHGW